MIIKAKNEQRGFAAILSVLIISAIALVLAKNTAYLGRADLDMINNSILSSTARTNSDSCVSELLNRLRSDHYYASTSLLMDLNNGTCQATLRNNMPDYQIEVEGRVYGYLYKTAVEARLQNGKITILSWNKK